MLNLAAIVGPTAVGKTSISISVAKEINAEIISCDSMQIYCGMDIGTAKASPDEQKMVSHHMIDIVQPDEEFSVADYQNRVKCLISNLNKKGQIPLLVGGTGLYYQAVVDDYEFFPMESRQEIRDKWNEVAENKGIKYIYEFLNSIDPVYAAIISSNDQKRIIRALEVYELTGQPFSQFQKKKTNTYNLASVGLYLERQELYKRIDLRVDDMMKKGLIDEVCQLREQGYNLNHNSMQALGYKQVLYYLDGFITYDELVYEIKRETRHYAKRQYTWFKKDKRIYWIDVTATKEEVLTKKISSYIEGQLSEM